MANDVWVGAYSLEQNKYCVERLDNLCAGNIKTYKDGFAGFAPLCFGASRDEAEAILAEARASKKTVFSEFESAITDAVKDLVLEDAEVRIVPADDCPEGDPYLNDGITVIPVRKAGSVYPVVGLNYYYRKFFANPDGYSDIEKALVAVADELLDDILDLWSTPPECPRCANEQNL